MHDYVQKDKRNSDNFPSGEPWVKGESSTLSDVNIPL